MFDVMVIVGMVLCVVSLIFSVVFFAEYFIWKFEDCWNEYSYRVRSGEIDVNFIEVWITYRWWA